jgi:hypothetical protein
MPIEEHIELPPESPAVEVRYVVSGAVGGLVLLFGTITVLHAIYQHESPIKTVPLPERFPRPQVVTRQADMKERRQLAAEQSQRLQTWRWADDRHTLVQIQIDRAMQLLMQKGAGAYAPLLPPQPALSSPNAGAQNAITPPAGHTQ